MSNNYYINLYNDSNIQFDSGAFKSIDDALEWAAGRGGIYTVSIMTDKGGFPPKIIADARNNKTTFRWLNYNQNYVTVYADEIKKMFE